MQEKTDILKTGKEKRKDDRMKRFTAILLAGILSCGGAATSFAGLTDNAAKWAKPSLEYA